MGLPTPHPDNIKLIMIAKAKVVIFAIGSLLSANACVSDADHEAYKQGEKQFVISNYRNLKKSPLGCIHLHAVVIQDYLTKPLSKVPI